MSFIDDARAVLGARILEAKELLEREQYVHRLLYREGEDPVEAYQLYHFLESHGPRQNNVLKDADILPSRRIVLIGNAGSGKSLVLTHAFVRAAETFLTDTSAPIPFVLDLRSELASDNDLRRALDVKYKGLYSTVLKEHAAGCTVLFDGLDERLLKESQRFVRTLEFFLQELGGRLAGSVIACRRAAWNSDWFKEESIRSETFHVDYLVDEDYAQIIPEQESREKFSKSCEELGISDLLNNPFDGFYLARRFATRQPLPRSRRECLDQRITDSLQRSAHPDDVIPPLHRLRYWARQLACISIFSSVDSYTPQEAVNCIGSSEVLRSTVDPDEIRFLFHCPLFRKQGDNFVFTHQLYSELLAAENLLSLSLRKQRQVLDAKLPAVDRVCTPYRGVAAFLAELCPSYCQYLLTRDPLVLFFAEAPGLSPEEDEILTRSVLDQSIADHRAPWWEIPPRGERPLNILQKHCPRNVGEFLKPYLEDNREIARLWTTACAEAWGGCSELNPILNRFANDGSLHSDARTWALEAIVKSGDVDAIRRLYDLFGDNDDRVRGYVLQAYRKLDSPGPREYLQKIIGGSRNRNLLCILQSEIKAFGLSLPRAKLMAAFQGIEEYLDQLEDLGAVILGGMFERATTQEFDEIPPRLIVRLWTHHHEPGRAYYEQPLRKLLKRKTVLGNLISYALQVLKDNRTGFHFGELAQFVGTYCDDTVFEVLPTPESTHLSSSTELWFVRRILQTYFYREPTSDRLAFFQQKAPLFTTTLQIPQTQQKERHRDILEERRIISDAMKGPDPINQTWRLLFSFARIEHGDRVREVKLEDVRSVLDRHPLSVKKKVFNVFRNCVSSIEYKKERIEEGRISMTVPQLEIPFWALHSEGETFDPKTLKGIVTCYGFRGSSVEDEQPYRQLLEEIREKDRELWKACVIEMIEDSFLHEPCLVFRYLVDLKDSLYVQRCSERLSNGWFSQVDFSDLLFYWRSFRPASYCETLRACYEHLRQSRLGSRRGQLAELPSDGKREDSTVRAENHGETKDESPSSGIPFEELVEFRPLLMLLAEDDHWAWQELGSRLQLEDVPVDVNLSDINPKRFPLNPKRLRIMADWYAFIRRRLQSDYGGHHDTAGVLLETIVTIGGEIAVSELRRLQNQRAFHNVEWLSHAILRIDDQMLSDAKNSLDVGVLLDFVNKSAHGAVSNNRDLFEWVCEAIDEIKASVELRAEWVAGFWNGNTPKDEPECQNILWPALKQKLENLGICNIEEKFIGPNKCDFWVVFPRKDNKPFQVAIELKVARAGYGRTDLIDPIEEQLWQKYMYPEDCRYGVYIVLWFQDNKRYSGPERWQSTQDLSREIGERSNALVTAQRVSLASYVIDLTMPYRKH